MLTAIFAIAICAQATNSLTVTNSIVPQSGTGSINIELENDKDYTAFTFKLRLPEGISYSSFVKSDRFTESHSVSATISGQNVSFGCLSSSNESIIGNGGTLITVNVTADASLAIGEVLDVTLTNIQFSTINGEENLNDVNFTITIGENRLVLDEASASAPVAATDANVRVKRTIKANEWSTICLPFAMSEAKVKEAFGNDVLLGDFNGYETTEDDGGDITGITVKFNSATAIEANHPYIIKVSTAVTEFAVDGVDINPEETPTKAAVKRTKKQWSEMIGTYVANTPVGDADEEAWCLFLSGNQFWYSMGQTKMKAFRAYFDFYDVITSVENASAPVFFSFDNETTGISTTPNDKRDVINDKVIYNLNGRRVVSPKTGLFIKNGKKVIVK